MSSFGFKIENNVELSNIYLPVCHSYSLKGSYIENWSDLPKTHDFAVIENRTEGQRGPVSLFSYFSNFRIFL